MSEYISREAVLKFQTELTPCICVSTHDGDIVCATKDADLVRYIESIPAADVVERPRWISVEERLPEDGVFVLVCNDDGHMMIAKCESELCGWYYKYTNYDFDVWDNDEQGPVRFWMPMPEPPEEATL